MSRDSELKRQAWRDYIRAVTLKTGLKPSPLAKHLGLNPSTLTRPLQEDFAGLPSADVMLRLNRFSGLPLPSVLFGDVAVDGFREPEVTPLEPLPEHGFDPNQSRWMVKGTALAGAGFLPGDELYCDASLTPAAEDLVIAQIRDFEGGASTVIRLYMPPFLVAAEAGIPSIKPVEVDNERVYIMTVMYRCVRARRQRAATAA